jgi:O-antigen/teichoic acid export membrane protein
VFAVVFILIGWEAFGALIALPVASAIACVLALWFLRPQRRAVGEGGDSAESIALHHISRSYTLLTFVGLLSFAVLVNMDAILVKSFFDPETAGNYGVVVTLGKMNLFIPLALGMVLFPKAVDRQATGRDPRPLLLLALGATLAAGLALTLVYFLIPGLIVDTIFRGQYANPGIVLGLVGIATTLYAATNIWLNYALSLRRTVFVVALAIIVVVQAAAIVLFHDELQHVALILVGGGLVANLIGAVTLARKS